MKKEEWKLEYYKEIEKEFYKDVDYLELSMFRYQMVTDLLKDKCINLPDKYDFKNNRLNLLLHFNAIPTYPRTFFGMDVSGDNKMLIKYLKTREMLYSSYMYTIKTTLN